MNTILLLTYTKDPCVLQLQKRSGESVAMVNKKFLSTKLSSLTLTADFKSTLERLVQRFQNDICTCYFREALLQTMSSMALEMQRTRADNEMKECQEMLLQTFVEDIVQRIQKENMFIRIAIIELLDCFCLKGISFSSFGDNDGF